MSAIISKVDWECDILEQGSLGIHSFLGEMKVLFDFSESYSVFIAFWKKFSSLSSKLTLISYSFSFPLNRHALQILLLFLKGLYY